jgi:glutaryl-CoA dehydrogenase
LGLQGCLRVGRLMDEDKAAARNDQPDQAQQLRRSWTSPASRDMRQPAFMTELPRHPSHDQPGNGQRLEGTHGVHALILGRAQEPGLQAFIDQFDSTCR